MSFTLFNPGDTILAEEINANFTQNNYGNNILPRDSVGNSLDSTLSIGSASYRFYNVYNRFSYLEKIYLKSNSLSAPKNPSGAQIIDEVVGQSGSDVAAVVIKRSDARVTTGETDISYNRVCFESGMFTGVGGLEYVSNKTFFTQKYNHNTGITQCVIEDSLNNSTNSLYVKIPIFNDNEQMDIINTSLSNSLTKIAINPTTLNTSSMPAGKYYYHIEGTLKNASPFGGPYANNIIAGVVNIFSSTVGPGTSVSVLKSDTVTITSSFTITITASSQFSGKMFFRRIGV